MLDVRPMSALPITPGTRGIQSENPLSAKSGHHGSEPLWLEFGTTSNTQHSDAVLR